MYCHKMGIVHRDIKPENLLLTTKDLKTGVVKVGDFGLARFLSGDQLAMTKCGTPGYVAPEILCEKPYRGEPADFWSMGIVLYILLSGEPPFYDEDSFLLYELIKNVDYSFEHPIWKQISSEAKDLIEKLLVANPNERLTGEQIMAHPWFTKSDDIMPSNVLEKMNLLDTSVKLKHLSNKPDSEPTTPSTDYDDDY